MSLQRVQSVRNCGTRWSSRNSVAAPYPRTMQGTRGVVRRLRNSLRLRLSPWMIWVKVSEIRHNACGNRAAAKRLGFVNTLQRRLRVHRFVIRRFGVSMAVKERDDIDRSFRQGKRKKITTVGKLIEELQLLPPSLKVLGGFDFGVRVGVTNWNDRCLAVTINEAD